MFLIRHLLLLSLFSQFSFAYIDFYPEDLDLMDPHNRLGGAIACKGCDTVMEMVKDKIPMLKQLGKGPMTVAVRGACAASSFGQIWLIPACVYFAEKFLDPIVDKILDGANPKDVCKLVGACPC